MSSATLTAAASASAPWLESLATARGSASRRTPVILQTEAAECGLACLAMVASHHGHRTDLASLRRRFELSMKGATLAHLIAFGQSLGLAARPLRLDLEHLPELALPAVLHWDMNHFVVLVAVRRGEVVIHDPARGRRVLRLAEFSKHFTGIALELTPGDGFERKAAPARPGLRALMGRVGGLGRAATQVLMLAIALEVFTLVSPFFLQWVVDGALVARDGDLLTVLVLGFGALVLVREAVSTARAWAMTVLSTQLNVQWLGNVFRHLLRLPVGWFEKRHLGDVVSRFESVHTLQRTLTHGFFEAVLDGVMAVVTLAMMFIYSAKLALVVLAATALYVLVRLALHRALYQATEEHIVAQAKERSHFLETVRGITSIKLFNAQADRVGRYMNLVVEATNRQVATQKLALGARFGHGVLWGVTGIVVVWLGAKAVLESAFSVGMLFAFVAYKDQFLQRVGGLIEKVFEWRMLGVQSDRLADIVTSEPEAAGEGGVIGVASARTEAASVAAPPSIEVRDLHFRYAATEAPVLAGVNLRIESGEAVAIVGASGSGKSTLGKVMLGLLPAGQGQVLIDGVPVDRLGLRRFREMVGTVMQEDQLFAGSIADNIAFFDPNPDQAWIIECARLAAIHDEIEAMPMRYDTLIGDMGAALSGGQKQRILLARALYKRPRILFLDEATSALDVANERLVNEAVRRLRLTRVIIAHRPETIAMADRVIVLAGGRVQQNLRAIDGTRPTDNHDNERNSA